MFLFFRFFWWLPTLLFAQRARRVLNFPGAANALPPGVTVRERTENARAAADVERPVSFRGIVRDIDYRPVARATVWLVNYRSERRDQTTFASPIETLTDAAGRFSFGEVDDPGGAGFAAHGEVRTNGPLADVGVAHHAARRACRAGFARDGAPLAHSL
ncbi:MAG: hypothetical protein ACREHD_08770 [Pirellulales bacterium]